MAHDPFDLEAQELARATVEDRAKLAAKNEADDIKWLMQSKRGRRIAHRFLSRAGVFKLSFNTNAAVMAFNEGKRNEGLALLTQLMLHASEQYNLMLKENFENG